MFKVGDIVGYCGLYRDFHKVVSINALGFETVCVSTMVSNTRRFYKNPRVRYNYNHQYSSNSFQLITKTQIQEELEKISEPYYEFLKTLP